MNKDHQLLHAINLAKDASIHIVNGVIRVTFEQTGKSKRGVIEYSDSMAELNCWLSLNCKEPKPRLARGKSQ